MALAPARRSSSPSGGCLFQKKLCIGLSALEFTPRYDLGLLTPAGKSARRGPRFGLGWYGTGLRPLPSGIAACLSKRHNHLRGF